MICSEMCDTHQPVFDLHLLARAEEEPSEATVMLDLSKDGFDIGVALRAETPPLFRVQTFACTGLQGGKTAADHDPPVVLAPVALLR